MKQRKKWIALLLVLALCVTGVNVTQKQTKAADGGRLYAEAVTAQPGEEITVPVLLDENPGMAGLGFDVKYDATTLTLKSADKGDALTGISNLQFSVGDITKANEEGKLTCFTTADSNFTVNGTVVTLTFQVAETAADGTYSVDFDVTECYDESFTNLTLASESASVTVGGSATSEPSGEPAGTTTENPGTEPGITGTVYTFVGEISGWSGPTGYPSSASHEAGNGAGNFTDTAQTNMVVVVGSPSNEGAAYGCGLELMNPYNTTFSGADNEMAVFIKTMKEPRIRVTLKNGGAASSWNWDQELSFPSGEEVELPSGYLNTNYFVLFGNDDTITKVEIYDKSASAAPTTQEPGQPADSAAPGSSSAPGVSQTPAAQKTTTPAAIKTKKTTDDEDEVAPSKPAKVKIKKVKAKKHGKIKITWKKAARAEYYQVQCSRNRGFYGKKSKIAYGRSTSIKLKGNKKYFVRVRAVRSGNPATYYNDVKGSWSTVKKIRTRK